eukprot:gene5170-5690_t
MGRHSKGNKGKTEDDIIVEDVESEEEEEEEVSPAVVEEDEEEETEEVPQRKLKKRSKSPSASSANASSTAVAQAKANKGNKSNGGGGYNLTAIGFLLLLILPAIFAGFLQVMDYLYPEAAKERRIRERVVKCFEAADPVKLTEVDDLLKKYKNKEYIMFRKMSNKYEKFAECKL